MAFAGNLRTLPLPDVFQTLNNIKATGVLRLRSQAGSRDVVFNQGEIIGVGFLDKQGREDIDLRLSLLGVESDAGQRLQGVTWYWTAMQARERANRAELDELVHEQAREQLHNLFAWNTAEFNFDESGPGKIEANELVARSLERPLSIDTATILLEAARQQDEWADLRARIRDETGAAAMGSSPTLGVQQSALEAVDKSEKLEALQPSESDYHLYLNGEWQGPYPRSRIVGMVQTGEVPVETWSYDQRTQDRKTLDQLLGNEAKRIRPEDLDALRQAVKAAEGRLAEERAGRAADPPSCAASPPRCCAWRVTAILTTRPSRRSSPGSTRWSAATIRRSWPSPRRPWWSRWCAICAISPAVTWLPPASGPTRWPAASVNLRRVTAHWKASLARLSGDPKPSAPTPRVCVSVWLRRPTTPPASIRNWNAASATIRASRRHASPPSAPPRTPLRQAPNALPISCANLAGCAPSMPGCSTRSPPCRPASTRIAPVTKPSWKRAAPCTGLWRSVRSRRPNRSPARVAVPSRVLPPCRPRSIA
jgi:hypothetical protein